MTEEAEGQGQHQDLLVCVTGHPSLLHDLRVGLEIGEVLKWWSKDHAVEPNPAMQEQWEDQTLSWAWEQADFFDGEHKSQQSKAVAPL